MLRRDPDTHSATTGTRTALLAYYGVTPAFVLVDLALGINVRLSFLESHDAWRVAYYGVLLACFVLMLVRPRWTAAVSAVESLVTMIGLIFSVAYGSLVVTTGMVDGDAAFVTPESVINLLISGPPAYFSWNRSLRSMFGA